jgi:hypothetical protein
MIATYLRQLAYMEEESTLRSIAKETQLTQQTLRNIKSGKIEPNSDYKNRIKNAYYRDSYSRLKSSGFSVENAKVYSRSTPEISSAWEANFIMKAHELTQGYLARYISLYHPEDNTQAIIDKYYDKFHSDVIEGIQNSRLTPEEILDY